MSKANIIEKDWSWAEPLTARTQTAYFIIHHTCGDPMQDTNEIMAEHLAQGWAGVGYHFMIKGDGTIVRGRPLWAIGAHAHGLNFNSIGIALLGNFQSDDPGYTGEPAGAQIDSLVNLLIDLYEQYGQEEQIIGHRDVAQLEAQQPNDDATDCPGDVLYNMLDAVRERVAHEAA